MRTDSSPDQNEDKPDRRVFAGTAAGRADVAISLNGRDKGGRFLVVGTEDGYTMLADGKGRRIDKPKRKKNKHVELEGRADDWIAAKLLEGGKVTNNDIRKALAQYAAGRGANSSEGGM